MPVCLDSLAIGQEYERTYLAELWGYESYHALSRGVVTPGGTNLIILFVTKNKQRGLTQYRDYIEGDILYWEDEAKHSSDERIANAAASGDSIHLFYRAEHHSPFTYYGEIKLVSYMPKTSEPGKFVFRILAMADGLFQCPSIEESDKYFEDAVSSEMLGDMELSDSELEHLAGLIAGELDRNEKPFAPRQESLSMAVFLVWMGCLYYQDGDYWGPVYQKLRLPANQVKWQSVLGECFLKTISKYKLLEFKGKLRYIIPILAHGYIPNSYLKNFCEDLMLAIYKDRQQAALPVQRKEIEHLVAAWRRDHEGYEECKQMILQAEQEEARLTNTLKVLKNKDILESYVELQAKLKDSEELQELLSFPEGWLNNAEAELAAYKEQYNAFRSLLDREREIKQAKKTKTVELKELAKAIRGVAGEVFERWEDGMKGPVIALPVVEIEKLAKKVEADNRHFAGIRGWILRLFVPSRYKEALRSKQQLAELLEPLPIQKKLLLHPWPELPQYLYNLQDKLKLYNKETAGLETLDNALQETAAAKEGSFAENMEETELRLEKLTQKIARYKTNLVKLGKGRLDDGMVELDEQRKLREQWAKVQTQIPGADFTLLEEALAATRDNIDIEALKRRLTTVRRQKKDAQERLKVYKNPLYSLNESTRVFIFQSGEKAVDFIYNSLVLIEKLHKGEANWESPLPKRIAQAMAQWWHQRGRDLLEEARTPRIEERVREAGGAHMRKPDIVFDVVEKVLKAVLPPQPVSSQKNARFFMEGESRWKQETAVPITVMDDGYRSEAAEIVLERPEPFYKLEFCCGETTCSWQIPGIGWDSFCMIFNKQGKFLENWQLPEDEAYIIAPAGSIVEPAGKMQEHLPGHWADYGYWFLELRNTDVVLVKTGDDVTICKRQVSLQPMFISGNALRGITAEGAAVYQEELPGLVFSVDHPEEAPFYGVRLEISGTADFKSLKQLKATLNKNNVVYLSLTEFYKNKYGLFTVTLVKRNESFWSSSCAVIPSLKLAFDKPFYRLQDEDVERGSLKLISEHRIEFYTENRGDAGIKHLSPTRVEFDTRLNSLRGCLAIYTNIKTELNVVIDIPGIRWRRPGENWRAEVEELWYDELGEIEIKVPAAAGNSVKVALKDEKQIITTPVQKGIARIDLRRFSDTLRESGKAVEKVMLSCLEDPPSVLAQVRTRWQAANINLTQRLQAGNRQLFLEWENLGKAANRVVLFWPLNMEEVKPLQYAIPDEVSSVEIAAPLEAMPQGRYRVQLAVADPWGDFSIEMPEQGAENSKDFDIGTARELLEAYVGKKLDIIEFYSEGQSIRLERSYWVEVKELELDSTFEGEIRLKGNVYSIGKEGKVEEMPFNPVSFYISDNKMPFLVDRDADGATYCQKCKVMFWEVEHKKECKPAIIVPETICCRVRG